MSVMAGLRRREIDTLEWDAFRWDLGILRIEPTKWFHPKSEDSIGDIEIDEGLLKIFREYRAKAVGSFVVQSKLKARPGAGWEHCRCTSAFENLIAWLRAKGLRRTSRYIPCGRSSDHRSARHGIYAASRERDYPLVRQRNRSPRSVRSRSPFSLLSRGFPRQD